MFPFNQQPQQQGSICIPAGCNVIVVQSDQLQQQQQQQQQPNIGSPHFSASPLSTSPIGSPNMSPRMSMSPQASFIDNNNNNFILTSNGFPTNNGSFIITQQFGGQQFGGQISPNVVYVNQNGQIQGFPNNQPIINRQSSLIITAPPSINFGVTCNSPTPLLSPEEISKGCLDLKDGIDLLNTDDSKLINTLSKYAPNQMDQIIPAYKAMTGMSLESTLKNITSGNFGKLCVALSKTVLGYDVWCLNDAIKGLGTDDDCLIDILIGRTNNDILVLNKVYKETYNKSLADDVRGDTSGDYRQLLISLLQGNREEANVPRDIENDVDILYKAGEGRLGTDESVFITLLTNRSYEHLKLVFERYKQKYSHTMEKAINGEFSGNLKKALYNLVRFINNPNEYVAEQFEKSMKGMGTRNDKLIRLTVRYRDPEAMKIIKNTYLNMYGKTLKKRIEGDTSGQFKKLLINCIGDM